MKYIIFVFSIMIFGMSCGKNINDPNSGEFITTNPVDQDLTFDSSKAASQYQSYFWRWSSPEYPYEEKREYKIDKVEFESSTPREYILYYTNTILSAKGPLQIDQGTSYVIRIVECLIKDQGWNRQTVDFPLYGATVTNIIISTENNLNILEVYMNVYPKAGYRFKSEYLRFRFKMELQNGQYWYY